MSYIETCTREELYLGLAELFKKNDPKPRKPSNGNCMDCSTLLGDKRATRCRACASAISRGKKKETWAKKRCLA